MSSSMIGALRVTLRLDSAAFTDGLARSELKMRKFDLATRNMAGSFRGIAKDFGVGGGTIGAVLDKIGAAGLVAGVGVGAAAIALQGMQKSLRFADDLTAASTKIGITAERLQELTYAAHENDITTEALKSSLEGLNVALGAYKSGVGDAKIKKAFEALGLTRADAALAQNASDLLPVLADRIAKVQSTAERVKLLQALGAADLEPVLNQGSEALERMSAKAHELGMVMSNDLAARAADANRELERMGEVLSGNLTIAFASAALAGEQAMSRLAPLLDLIRKLNREMGAAQGAEAKAKGAEYRAKAAAIEAKGGPNENSRTYRAMADRWDPPTYNMGSAEEYAQMQADYAASRTTTTASPDPAARSSGSRSRAGRRAPSDSYAGRTVEVITIDPEVEGILAQLEYWRGVEERGRQPITVDANPDGFQSSMDRVAEAMRPTNEALTEMQARFSEVFTGGLLAALHDGKDGVQEWMRQGAERGLEQALNNLADLLFKLFSQAGGGLGNSIGGGGGGLGSGIGSILSAVFGTGSGLKVPRFATGGGFTFGGSGGVDSQLAIFRGTPGEMVDIHHGDGGAKGGVTQHFDLRGAVVTEKLYGMMQATAAQAAAQVYGQIKGEQAVQARSARYRVAR